MVQGIDTHGIETRFDLNSTADDVAGEIDLRGMLAVVTGSAAGIGKETARVLAARGADVVLGGRSKIANLEAAAEISPSLGGRVLPHEIDLLSLKSVRQFADAVLSLGRPVDLLILNAGIMACPLARSPDGIESQLATNFMGHALLTSELAPAILKSSRARVISLSSSAHQMSPIVFDDINYQSRAYDAWEAYAQSKTANALLAVKVWQELGPFGVTAHTLHPGGVYTGLLKHMTGDIAADLSQRYRFDASTIQLKTIQQGAATTLWVATEPSVQNRPTHYFEDCRPAELLDEPIYTHGVMRYALDDENAAALWRAAERMTGTALPLSPQ